MRAVRFRSRPWRWLSHRWHYRPYGKVAGTLLVIGLVDIATITAMAPSLMSDSQLAMMLGGFGVFFSSFIWLLTLGPVPSDRLIPSDRKNPFCAQIEEQVRHMRSLRGRKGEEAEAERSKTADLIRQLRKWPADKTREEIEAIDSEYVASTQADRNLSRLEAELKLQAYQEIEAARLRALNPSTEANEQEGVAAA